MHIRHVISLRRRRFATVGSADGLVYYSLHNDYVIIKTVTAATGILLHDIFQLDGRHAFIFGKVCFQLCKKL